jgi:lysophospholipase L1-like esterase
MKKWFLAFSLGLNLALIGVLVFLNERYGLLRKIQRVALEEGRILGLVPHHELNRNYQARREMFQLDRNKSARVLMLGDSLTAQGEWNAMLGAPLVANRGIDGDTSAGVLARLGDDADFRGDAVVIWIGTNDVLQGVGAGPVAERIIEAAWGKAEKLKINLTTEGTENTEEEAGLGLGKPSGAAFSNPSTSGLARDSEKSSLTRSASGPASLPGTAPEAQVFVLGIPPMARWWEGAGGRNAVIREINTKLTEGANKNGYRFIELDSVLADEKGFLGVEMTSDGVHLSAKGYVAILEKMRSAGVIKPID